MIFALLYYTIHMIDLQSPAIIRWSSHLPCYSPSPWGEGRGEGELYRIGHEPALIKLERVSLPPGVSFSPILRVSAPRPLRKKSIQGFPRPFKAIKAHLILFKGFLKSIFLSVPKAFADMLQPFNASTILCTAISRLLMPAYAPPPRALPQMGFHTSPMHVLLCASVPLWLNANQKPTDAGQKLCPPSP